MYCSLHNLASARRRPGHSLTHTLFGGHTLFLSLSLFLAICIAHSLFLYSPPSVYFHAFFSGGCITRSTINKMCSYQSGRMGGGSNFVLFFGTHQVFNQNILAQFTFVRPLKRMRLFTLNEWRARIANVQRTLLAQIMLSSVLALALRMHSIHYRAVIVHIACR